MHKTTNQNVRYNYNNNKLIWRFQRDIVQMKQNGLENNGKKSWGEKRNVEHP